MSIETKKRRKNEEKCRRFRFQNVSGKTLSTPTQFQIAETFTCNTVSMNYEHLYSYLDTRPLPEIKACMLNVVNLVRKHSGDVSASDIDSDFDEEEIVILTANQKQSRSRRSKISERMWTHQAVLNKFGSRSKDIISPPEASDAVSVLIVLPKVVEYMMSINSCIDNEVHRESCSNSKILPERSQQKNASIQFPANTKHSRDRGTQEMETTKTPKRARASTPVTPKHSHDDRTVGSSDVSAEEGTEWWVDGNKTNNVVDTPGTSTSSTGPSATPNETSGSRPRSRTVWTKDMVRTYCSQSNVVVLIFSGNML